MLVTICSIRGMNQSEPRRLTCYPTPVVCPPRGCTSRCDTPASAPASFSRLSTKQEIGWKYKYGGPEDDIASEASTKTETSHENWRFQSFLIACPLSPQQNSCFHSQHHKQHSIAPARNILTPDVHNANAMLLSSIRVRRSSSTSSAPKVCLHAPLDRVVVYRSAACRPPKE